MILPVNCNGLLLREAKPEDACALLDIYAPYVLNTAITFEYTVPSVKEFAARMREVQAMYPYIVAEKEGSVVGYAYASAFHARAAYGWCVETTVYVAPGQRRAGVGKALYAQLEQLLKLQNITNLNACIASPEPEDEYLTADSLRFHSSMGFSTVGRFHQCGYKFGRWYNMVWMEKLIGDHTHPQPPVIPFFEICGKNSCL